MSESAQIAVPELPQRPQMFSIVRQYSKMLIIGAVLGLAIGLALALTRQQTFTCQATLLFPSAVPSGGAVSAILGGGGGDPSLPILSGALSAPQVGSNANTAVLMVESHRLGKQVIHKLGLKEKWKLDDWVSVTRKFENNLQCSPGKSGELYVSFRDQSKELSYKVTKQVLNELKVLIAELRMDPAADNVTFLQKKVDGEKKKLENAQRSFATYQRKTQLLDLTSQGQFLAQRYADLQKDAAAAQLEAEIADRQVSMLSSSTKQMVTSAIDPNPSTGSTLSPLYQKVKEAEAQLALLKYQLTDDHPQVQEQKRILFEARQQLRAETNRQLSVVNSGASPMLNAAIVQAAASRARAAGLQQATAGVVKKIDQLPNQAAGFLNLQAQVQGHAAAVLLYQTELEKAKILTQSRGPSLIELDPPELPLTPNKTSRTMLVLFCVMLGIALASIFPYREWQQRNDEYEDLLYVMRQNQFIERPRDVQRALEG